jgi:anti-sigma B factor antagonist
MTYTVDNQENYTLITFNAADLAPASAELMANKQNIVNENQKYLILDLSTIKTASPESLKVLQDLNSAANELHGIFILTHVDDAIDAGAEKFDFNIIPTVEEAVDFVFIEQIEKEYFSDEEPE